MRKPTPLMKAVRQWRELTSRLLPMCAPESLDLATLSAEEVERLRVEADALGALLGAWQILHRGGGVQPIPEN